MDKIKIQSKPEICPQDKSKGLSLGSSQDLSTDQCTELSGNLNAFKQARLARDPRFDGKFYIGVKTTGIYCRPICPAPIPKEENVTYHLRPTDAANAGYRPCLRCCPDLAPGSKFLPQSDNQFEKAIQVLNEETEDNLELIANRLGFSDRYLRKLFQQKLGMSPSKYWQYQRLLFAKQLLQMGKLKIQDVAYSAGFQSVRQFNRLFKQWFEFTPSELQKKALKKGAKKDTRQTTSRQPRSKLNSTVSGSTVSDSMTFQVDLKLSYRPPYDIEFRQTFLTNRAIEGLDWVKDSTYGRTLSCYNAETNRYDYGWFELSPVQHKHYFLLQLHWPSATTLRQAISVIRFMLDLDADPNVIDHYLVINDFPFVDTGITQSNDKAHSIELSHSGPHRGIRIPGLPTPFEAAVRAVLGQQVTVKSATNLTGFVIDNCGVRQGKRVWFPNPEDFINFDYESLKMPKARQNTLKNVVEHFLKANKDRSAQLEALNSMISLKGIGPWSQDYALIRGASHPDIWLGGDAGVKQAIEKLSSHQGLETGELATNSITPKGINHSALPKEPSNFENLETRIKPWRSYGTLYLWSTL